MPPQRDFFLGLIEQLNAQRYSTPATNIRIVQDNAMSLAPLSSKTWRKEHWNDLQSNQSRSRWECKRFHGNNASLCPQEEKAKPPRPPQRQSSFKYPPAFASSISQVPDYNDTSKRMHTISQWTNNNVPLMPQRQASEQSMTVTTSPTRENVAGSIPSASEHSEATSQTGASTCNTTFPRFQNYANPSAAPPHMPQRQESHSTFGSYSGQDSIWSLPSAFISLQSTQSLGCSSRHEGCPLITEATVKAHDDFG